MRKLFPKSTGTFVCKKPALQPAVFFLKLGCLSGCFDRILLLSAGSGYHTLSEGTLRIPFFTPATLVHGCTSEAQSEYGYEFVPVAANQISLQEFLESLQTKCGIRCRQTKAVSGQSSRKDSLISRKILQVEVPASYIQTFRCFREEAFPFPSPTYCTNLTRCLHISTKKNVTFSQV